MAYNCDTQDREPRLRGIYLRTAARPFGPWSAAVRILYDSREGSAAAYGVTLHANANPRDCAQQPCLTCTPDGAAEGAGRGFDGYDDGLSQPVSPLGQKPGSTVVVGHQKCEPFVAAFGGEYAPFLVPSWSYRDSRGDHLFFTLSSGNLYQVHLMEAVLTEDGTRPVPPRPGPLARRDLVNPDFSNFPAAWNVFGGPFYPRFQCGPRWCLTTFGPGQDNTRGSIWQSFVPAELTAKLCFLVHGGSNVAVKGADAPNASIRLVSGVDVVRESRGRSPMPDGSAWPDSLAVWDLTEFIGREVTLEIHDERLADTYGWDFVGTSQFIQDSTVDACIARLGVTR